MCVQVPRVIPIGPLLLPHAIEEGMSEENRSVMEWLEMQRPRSVLYIAFGSLVKMAPEQVTEIACALEACKQTAFLWVAGTPIIRPNEPPPPLVSQLLPAGLYHPPLFKRLLLLKSASREEPKSAKICS